ncbi:fluoroacetate dehalogenase [Siccirubricoccus deserti]|uniref:Alpha/beta hydrolase n=1 Tax=Siccirubricoccus deserti TaxID=2013562 RepID=A0A9X0QZ87_9PROT|nr:alpha/beta hydrolase [Siccirubricoccus deserti]MBC4016395.1 alpha/beta hydrolase [Siccirubricoccus deserti]GGC49341.1 fluoroacetate dehalogenase [Siccirubricoccus deserti]
MFFESFTPETREANGQRIRLRRGGSGPPLLLLHGNPQTHAMWHRLAPILANRFTIIAPDIRGYGFSAAPPATPDSRHYAKREMARDLVLLMQGLGHDRFGVVSHDRGARVAHRLALDHPAAVDRLVTMDIIPTLEHFERADMHFALGYYHWFFLAQPHDKPERMILRDTEDWFDLHTSREPKDRGFFHPGARADYLAALREPGTVTAICEDYRAAIGIDLEHDRASRAAGQKVECPLLALWGAKGSLPRWYDVLEIWRQYASGPVSGSAVNSGHYLAEEAPEECLARLEGFL